MLLLMDGDILAFRCAAASENEDDWIATSRLDKLIDDTLRITGATEYNIYLTGDNNFRYSLYPDYKANRKDKPRPYWLPMLREYLVREYNATVTDGYEADDALAMNQTDHTMIASIDKDLLQVAGSHFNFVKGEFYEVDFLTGLKSFYRNMLIGDTSDNIRGVDKIGKVKAAKLIDCLETEQDMFDVVRSLYNDDVRFKMNGQCMWLWRYEGDIWNNYEDLISAEPDISFSESIQDESGE